MIMTLSTRAPNVRIFLFELWTKIDPKRSGIIFLISWAKPNLMLAGNNFGKRELKTGIDLRNVINHLSF